jgi:hypothetical protein
MLENYFYGYLINHKTNKLFRRKSEMSGACEYAEDDEDQTIPVGKKSGT